MESGQVKWVLGSLLLKLVVQATEGYIGVVYGVMLDWVGSLNIIRTHLTSPA